jgi:hypothetical protein
LINLPILNDSDFNKLLELLGDYAPYVTGNIREYNFRNLDELLIMRNIDIEKYRDSYIEYKTCVNDTLSNLNIDMKI